MAEIIKIVIRSESGYGCIDDAYEDSITVKPTGISYHLASKKATLIIFLPPEEMMKLHLVYSSVSSKAILKRFVAFTE